MSIQAMAWAFKQRDIADPMQRYVLLCLANYAGEDGKNAFPSVGRLCSDSGLSESTVRRSLKDLEAAGIIKTGNQAVVAAYIDREDRRPVLYDLVITRGAPQTPREASGVSHGRSGVSDRPERGVPQTPNPSSNRQITKEADAPPKSGGAAVKGRGPPPVEEVLRGREVVEGREPSFAAEFRKRFGTDPV